MFKSGDRVVCVDAGGNRYISTGTEYEVAQVVKGSLVLLDPETKHIINYGTAYNPDRFDKVGETMNNGVIELNGKKYKVEVIEGKGECLVPVKALTWKSMMGKIVKSDDAEGFCSIVKRVSGDRIQIIPLTGGAFWNSLSGASTDEFPESYQLVADSLSEAIQKGLVK